MITLASNFFYTVTLPVTLWFFDREKTIRRICAVIRRCFIDAGKIYNQVTRAYREFTQTQLLNLASIVWLYRGENDSFMTLRALYGQARDAWRDSEITNPDSGKTYKGIAAQREELAEAFRALGAKLGEWFRQVEPLLTEKASAALAENAAWKSSVEALAAVGSS